MSALIIAPLLAVYIVGCLASFFIHVCEMNDGYQLSARILLWPLFIIKAALLMCRAAYLDLAGKLQ